MIKDSILVIGASGQIGTELVENLRALYGTDSVLASDVKMPKGNIFDSGPFELLDAMDETRLYEIVDKYKITQIYLLAALLSATAEKNIELGWALNMRSLSHVLELARHNKIKNFFWPRSIAVVGPTSPSLTTPQHTVIVPYTVYGISKQAGERWCEYYHQKFDVDVRSLRYPGLISWKADPGGGTTDYAIHMFHQALKNKHYECFLSENITLPMMYMPDAIRATLELMDAPSKQLKIRSSYNIAGISFNPKGLADSIKTHIPDFKISYKIDERQEIANSWPQSIDDTVANNHWGWKSKFDLAAVSEDMIKNLKKNKAPIPWKN